MQMPKRSKPCKSYNNRSFPELIVITDGTEQPTSQDRKIVPKENRTIQAKRKKTYTVQNQIAMNLDRVIVHKSAFSRQSS